jgi:hypothetical protein
MKARKDEAIWLAEVEIASLRAGVFIERIIV